MRLGIISMAAAAAISLSFAAATAQTTTTPSDIATPSTATAPASADAVGSTGDPNKIICKRTSETGTRLGGKRICQTQNAWDEQARQAQMDIQRAQDRGNTFGGHGG